MLNLFVVCWDTEILHEKITPFLIKGWNVGYAFKNELQTKSLIEKLRPDVIVIYLNVAAKKGRLVAKFIKETGSINHIPIIFIDGKPKDVIKIRNEFPNAIYTSSEELEKVLLKYEI
ncbi:MAG: hypothetical protein ACTSPN_01535 [Promethearchaeota archaeon]